MIEKDRRAAELLEAHGSEVEHDQLLDARFWDDPLGKFANATGLSVSLWSISGVLKSGPHASSPLTKRLLEGEFWHNPQHLGFKTELSLVKKVVSTKSRQDDIVLHSLGVTACPAFQGEKLVGVFVLGWRPEDFPNPVASDLIAKSVNLKSMDIWQIIRMQPPMTKDKRVQCSEMLSSFAEALLSSIEKRINDSQRVEVLKVLNESSVALTMANDLREICAIAIETTKRLVPALSVSIRILSKSGEMQEQLSHPEMRETEFISEFASEERAQVPIILGSGEPIGVIEIRKTTSRFKKATVAPQLEALAAQVAVAIQKYQMFLNLKNEQKSLEQANKKLRNLSKLKDEFLATLSHELRTPLNSILGWSQLLADDEVDPDELKSACAAIERNARIQSRLIEDLLDVSRIISGKMPLNREVVDAVAVMRSAIETVHPIAEAKKIQIFSHLPEAGLLLKGDAARVQQVFWNLLSNSVKFTPEGGEITILIKPAGAYFQVDISDTGKGIPTEFIPFIFDRFSQVDGSNTRQYGGLGLGLAIVRHIVELHGGTISAKSDGEGRGSSFTILLPNRVTDLELDVAKEIMADTEAEQHDLPLSGLSILAVDDEPDSLRLLKFVLEKNGASVITAESAPQALIIVQESHPDIIVSDISMPGENGHDLIKNIRLLPPSLGGSTPVFALTALTSASAKTKAFESGFQKYFEKPINPKAIVEALSSYVSIR